MTAEIVLMNTEAVALAADSAVSTSNKIFNSANKIFMAAPNHPVGIMIYHNARFMGVPWEVVIKLYREYLGQKERPLETLSLYVEDFIGFLKANMYRLCPTNQQVQFFEEEARLALQDVVAVVDRDIQIATAINPLDADAIQTLTAKSIQQIRARLAAEPDFFPEPPEALHEYILEAYHDILETMINELFENRPLTSEARQDLRQIALYVNTKFFDSAPYTGVVFAGFGEEDLYPITQSFLVGGVVHNTLKYRPQSMTRAGYFGTAGAVLPFAQKDMVISYMTGIHPQVADFLLDVLPEMLMMNLEALFEHDGEFGVRTLKKMGHVLFTDGIEAVQNTLLEILGEASRLHSEEIVQIVSVLPKDELAALAEALVTLTSLRRRFSFSRETVGGPVDVALISKKDGFIWVKRKHYFDAALNVHFDPL
ncbi:MAG: hypothetical protein CUN55_00180 [Phototrophicales bacterium]|nr:MAG: hypothetical protein CUN55_00180 [Phototrophicales bacterium]